MKSTFHAAQPLVIRGLILDPLVLNASGAVDPFSVDPAWRCEPELVQSLGGFVTKTTTEEVRTGNPHPWVEVHPDDDRTLINAVGLANPGIDATLQSIDAMADAVQIPIVLSIAGDAQSCQRMVARAERYPQIVGYEVNLSCPNVSGGLIGADEAATRAVIAAVRSATERAVIAKLTPASNIARIGAAAEHAGADALTAINTMPVHAVHNDGRPILGTVNAGLSGRMLHFIAVRCVAEVAVAVRIPVIGVGGVACAASVGRMFHAGASAVGVGTGIVLDPTAIPSIVAAAGCGTSQNML